jgi:4-amino-4-deoxy-L-arabinose transferase-like glycosyltransferase
MNYKLILIGILFLGFILRLLFLFNSPIPLDVSNLPNYYPDENIYWKNAEFIINNGFYEFIKNEISLTSALLPPLLISGFFKFTESLLALRFFYILLSVLTLFFLYKLTKKIFSSLIALAVTFMAAINFNLIKFSPTILTEIPFIFFLVLSIYLLILIISEKEGNLYYYFCASLTLCLLVATRTVAIPLLIGFFIFIFITDFIYKDNRNGKFKNTIRLFFILSFSGIFALSIIVKNYYYFNEPMIATGGGAVLWLGSRLDTQGDEPPYYRLEYGTKLITKNHSHLSIEGNRLLMDEALKSIKDNPLSWIKINLKKTSRLFFGNNYSWFFPHRNIASWFYAKDDGGGKSLLKLANKLLQILFNTFVAIFGIYFLSKQMFTNNRNDLRILSGFIFGMVIAYVPFMVVERFMMVQTLLLSIPSLGYILSYSYKDIKKEFFILFSLTLIISFYILFGL